MAITLIGNNKATASGSSTATTAGGNITNAKLLIAIVCMYSKSAATATVSSTSNASGNWTALPNYVNGNSNICIWYCANPTTSASEAFSANPNGTGYPAIFASWWDGVTTTSPKDQATGASGTSNPLATGSVTPSEDNELLVTGVSHNVTGNTTVDGGFTRQDTQTNASFETGAWAYLIQTTLASANPAWTVDGSAKAVAIATFKVSGGGGGPTFVPTSNFNLMGCGV